MKRNSYVRAAGTAAGLALLLAGCGENIDSNAPLSGPRARYVAKADPICAEARTAIGGHFGNDPEKEKAALDSALEKLRAIPKPGEEVEKLQVFLVEIANAGLALEDLVQSKIVNNQGRIDRALTRAREADARAAKAADDYGFIACSRTLEDMG